jgi:hypothetical protein
LQGVRRIQSSTNEAQFLDPGRFRKDLREVEQLDSSLVLEE